MKETMCSWVCHVKDILCKYGFAEVWENQEVDNESRFIKLFEQRCGLLCGPIMWSYYPTAISMAKRDLDLIHNMIIKNLSAKNDKIKDYLVKHSTAITPCSIVS